MLEKRRRALETKEKVGKSGKSVAHGWVEEGTITCRSKCDLNSAKIVEIVQ